MARVPNPLGTARVVAILRCRDAGGAVAAGEALVQGGIGAVEITFTTPDATVAIRELKSRVGARALVGAGTLTSPADVEAALQAGAEFLVSPGTEQATADEMRASGRPWMPGICTPSEIMCAVNLGAPAVKLFPASLGGPALLRALAGPFPDLAVVPTGGVTLDTIAAWFAAGAVAIGAGNELCSSADVDGRRWAEIERLAGSFVLKAA